jgi:hypothetical protein
MIDLFGLEQQPKRIHDKPEAAALVEVLKALRTHSLVAWAERQNSGAALVRFLTRPHQSARMKLLRVLPISAAT